MNFDALAHRAAARAATGLHRRSFIKLTGAGTFALAAVPRLHAQTAATELKPQQLPGPFVAIAAESVVTQSP